MEVKAVRGSRGGRMENKDMKGFMIFGVIFILLLWLGTWVTDSYPMFIIGFLLLLIAGALLGASRLYERSRDDYPLEC